MTTHIVDHKELIAFLNAAGRDRCTIIAIDGIFLKIIVDDQRKLCDNTITNSWSEANEHLQRKRLQRP